jgi:cell division protein FtsB
MKNWGLRIGYVLALMMAVVYAFFTMRGPHGISAWMDQLQQIRQYEERNAVLTRENQTRREYIDRLEKNPDEQGLVIRERLKLVKPNEKVFMKRPE